MVVSTDGGCLVACVLHSQMTKDQGAEPNLHKAFASMDRDGDKKVSHQEYIAVQGLDLFSRRDQNKDGRLSLKEYTEFDPSKDPNELASIFEELDADNDKKLSRTEARGLHQDDADKDDPELKSHECKLSHISTCRLTLYQK